MSTEYDDLCNSRSVSLFLLQFLLFLLYFPSDTDDVNEIDQYLDCRYVCAPEACHHIFGFPCQIKSHTIYRLPIHLPDRQTVVFKPGKEKSAVASSEKKETKLTAFFKFNLQFKEMETRGDDLTGKVDPRDVSYMDFPSKFVWNDAQGAWKERVKGGEKTIGRMYAVSPNDPERFALRLILLATKGATSFEDLKTVSDETGSEVTHPTFILAARALGLLKDDKEFVKALQECESFQMPSQMRATFSSLIVFHEIGDPQLLWDTFKKSMSEDFVFRGCSEEEAEAMSYEDIKEKMSRLGKNIESFIMTPTFNVVAPNLNEPDYTFMASEGERLYATLNYEQKTACDDILNSVDNPSLRRLFFLKGCGGSGKTYLYNVLYMILTGRKILIQCNAWTGNASTLLPNGRTIASCFKMDINQECRVSLLKMNSKEAALLRETDVFIEDEASMIPKDAVHTMDQVLRDIMGNDLPFGGKVMIFGGDFRQVLPVVRRGSRTEQVDGCMKMSPLWSQFKELNLISNLRVTSGDNAWMEFLLSVGDGSANNELGRVELDPSVYTNGDLIEEVFGSSIDQFSDLSECAILAPKNVDVDKLNDEVHKRMIGTDRIYYSRDELVDDSNSKLVTTEYLNSINTSSLPPHQLKLKKGSIVMLLRNLDVSSGLCNGTRLTIVQLGRRVLKCKFSTGSRKGEDVLIPKIDCYDDKNLAFKLRRTQFPVRLAFTLSINKSQDQSFSRIGLWLQEDVFSHGQLYVALSRIRSKEGLFVKSDRKDLLNVVYHEAL